MGFHEPPIAVEGTARQPVRNTWLAARHELRSFKREPAASAHRKGPALGEAAESAKNEVGATSHLHSVLDAMLVERSGKQDRSSRSLQHPTPPSALRMWHDVASEGLGRRAISFCLASKVLTCLLPNPAQRIWSTGWPREQGPWFGLSRCAQVHRKFERPICDVHRCTHSIGKQKSTFEWAHAKVLEMRSGQHGTSFVSANDTTIPESLPVGACG